MEKEGVVGEAGQIDAGEVDKEGTVSSVVGESGSKERAILLAEGSEVRRRLKGMRSEGRR